MINVIGDIAGNFNTLMALIEKMPEGEVLCTGDLIDRGPRSDMVLDWFMENGRAIMGNHEHMMLNHHDETGYYEQGLWLYNGGGATAKKYDWAPLPNKVLNWVSSLPLYLEIDGCLISHAFVDPDLGLEKACELGSSIEDNPRSIIWNRYAPERMEGYRLQIAGHNPQFGLRRWSDEQGEFAISIDTSREKVLTGIHLPSGETYQQEYID